LAEKTEINIVMKPEYGDYRHRLYNSDATCCRW